MRFLARCGPFTLTCRDSSAPIGTYLRHTDSVGVFYLFTAILAWQLGSLPAATLALLRTDCVDVRPLLCGYHGSELEIPVYPAHRFLNPDYIVFGRGGVAFSEAGLRASFAIVRRGIHAKLLLGTMLIITSTNKIWKRLDARIGVARKLDRDRRSILLSS